MASTASLVPISKLMTGRGQAPIEFRMTLPASMARWERKLPRSTQPTNAAPKGPCHRITSRSHSRQIWMATQTSDRFILNVDAKRRKPPNLFRWIFTIILAMQSSITNASEFTSEDCYLCPSTRLLRSFTPGIKPGACRGVRRSRLG